MESAGPRAQSLGWGRFVLVSQGADPAAEAPLATAPTAMEAFLQLAPTLRLVASGHGQVVLSNDGSRLEKTEFSPGSDWILAGIDEQGQRHALLPTALRRAGTHADVWNRIPEVARRIAQRRWAELNTLVSGSQPTSVFG